MTSRRKPRGKKKKNLLDIDLGDFFVCFLDVAQKAQEPKAKQMELY